eukprot:13727139-Ditylum_brightwellii.AAC.1
MCCTRSCGWGRDAVTLAAELCSMLLVAAAVFNGLLAPEDGDCEGVDGWKEDSVFPVRTVCAIAVEIPW